MTTSSAISVCPECGGRNEPGDQFCGDCGSYLAWEEQPAEPTPEAVAESDAASAAAPPPQVGGGAAGATDEPSAAAPSDFGAASLPVSPGAQLVPPVTPAPRAGEPAQDSPDELASEIASPPEPERVALRKPAASAVPPRRTVAPPPTEQPLAPDDVVCPSCGAGNRPERRFCRRCATELRAAVARTASAQPAAGSRPRGRNTRFPFTALIVLLVILGVLFVGWLNRDAVIGFMQDIVGFVFSPTDS